MTYDLIEFDVSGAVATITWNRPDELNPLSEPMLDEFRRALKVASADLRVKAVVLRGAGRAFSAGGDFVEQPPKDPRSGLPQNTAVGEYMLEVRRVMRDWYSDYILISDLRIPVIAQVHGWCLGGASWLAAAADITIASSDATFGQPEVRQGQPAGLIWALTAGWKHALRYSLTGDHLDAAEALRIGLVNEVVPPEALDAKVSEVVRRICLLTPESIELNKAMIRRGMDAMGFRNALVAAGEQGGWLFGAWLPDVHGVFEQSVLEDGVSAAVRRRDEQFWPEPFGPHADRARGGEVDQS